MDREVERAISRPAQPLERPGCRMNTVTTIAPEPATTAAKVLPSRGAARGRQACAVAD